jgi:hypothetical protein
MSTLRAQLASHNAVVEEVGVVEMEFNQNCLLPAQEWRPFAALLPEQEGAKYRERALGHLHLMLRKASSVVWDACYLEV